MNPYLQHLLDVANGNATTQAQFLHQLGGEGRVQHLIAAILMNILNP